MFITYVWLLLWPGWPLRGSGVLDLESIDGQWSFDLPFAQFVALSQVFLWKWGYLLLYSKLWRLKSSFNLLGCDWLVSAWAAFESSSKFQIGIFFILFISSMTPSEGFLDLDLFLENNVVGFSDLGKWINIMNVMLVKGLSCYLRNKTGSCRTDYHECRQFRQSWIAERRIDLSGPSSGSVVGFRYVVQQARWNRD